MRNKVPALPLQSITITEAMTNHAQVDFLHPDVLCFSGVRRSGIQQFFIQFQQFIEQLLELQQFLEFLQ